jgi:hypothetical protein
LGGSAAGSHIEKSPCEKEADTDGAENDTFGNPSSSTVWEIATQNAAAAATYAKKIKADQQAAEKLRSKPEKPLPYRFIWPGKPCDDVFVHWFFSNLTVGSMEAPPSLPLPSAALGGSPTALHVQLVLELLLLCWPDLQVPYVAAAASALAPLKEYIAMRRWDWLLLMMALLQQTSTEQKQQVLRQRGPLLMKLLYQILLEDEGLGGGGKSELVTASGDTAWLLWFLTVKSDAEVYRSLEDWKVQFAASVPMAVAMVLQNLLFESLPEVLMDARTARIGKVLHGSFGK